MQLASSYTTSSGIRIERKATPKCYETAVSELALQLDTKLGCLLSSSYEYPNRYKRWDMGFIDPILMITTRLNDVRIQALNKRGEILLPSICNAFEGIDYISDLNSSGEQVSFSIIRTTKRFTEEERSHQPSVFSALRILKSIFYSEEDDHLGLYGAFGYDLAFQFEQINFSLEREKDQRDMVLFIPDAILIRDHSRQESHLFEYELTVDGNSTSQFERTGSSRDYKPAEKIEKESDHKRGEYADIARIAQEWFARGDLFEAVPGQMFFLPCKDTPSEVFLRLQKANPSPYGFIMNLGNEEYLVGASPEMFVRVTGDLVETCPISGTISRGEDAIADADQIKALLNSDKDHYELTMCTDVDRNDKSRICVPGSVEVVGRRQIELYSRLIHTVDHVKGRLKNGFDGLDAFLGHTWAVTVTGAPKLGAMKFLEKHEKSARRWYGGAVGKLGFNGDVNTGLTLRTVRIAKGVAEVRVGATLLFDSIPEAEEEETHLKASALIKALKGSNVHSDEKVSLPTFLGKNKKVLLIDHQDSFVHTLADYFRQTGANVTTLRSGFEEQELDDVNPDLVVLSPGPGCPKDFNLSRTIGMVIKRSLPVFGVCLGLQGLVEHFGGTLSILPRPYHGRPSDIKLLEPGRGIFTGITEEIVQVGRYHSLYVDKTTFPSELHVTAETEEGVVMAVRHNNLPIAAVQFHPESIMSFKKNVGITMVNNVYRLIDQ
ncbi:anthranilate synthase component I [Candidatus Endobugula sertula]|uniref:Anthranilate synthase n=1 Tax=Candidatus Endobugula sertula TaxID=62101 RepID=A0A1D2QTF7_9GAMM|nr:anthranilate synthase component I [Candidatus Endobugula sertula]